MKTDTKTDQKAHPGRWGVGGGAWLRNSIVKRCAYRLCVLLGECLENGTDTRPFGQRGEPSQLADILRHRRHRGVGANQ